MSSPLRLSSYYNKGLNYPVEEAARIRTARQLTAKRAKSRQAFLDPANVYSFADLYLASGAQEWDAKSRVKSSRRPTLAKENKEIELPPINNNNNKTVVPPSAYSTKPSSPLSTTRSLEDDENFNSNDFNGNEISTNDNNNNNNKIENNENQKLPESNLKSDNNFFVNDEGRLTKVKSVELLKNPNIHDYLFSLSKNKTEKRKFEVNLKNK